MGVTEQPRTELAGTERDPTLKARISGLFPLDAVGRIGPRRVVLGVIFVVVTAVASLARQSGPGALDSIWAEDGLTFYQTTFHTDAFHAVFIPNNGYLQLVPRILIPLIALFPVSWAAALMAAVGALASSACALLVYHASAALVPSRVARLCFVVPTAVVLVGEVEVGNDVVNIQWYLISATFWMMLWNPRTRARRALAALVLFLAIGSDPLALVFAPLLALRLWSRPLRESAWQLGGTAAGVLLQGGAILSGSLSSRPPVHDYSVPFALRGYWQYVSGRTLASTPELSHVGLSQPIGAQIAGAVAALLVAVAALLLNRSADRLLAAVCAAFSLVFYSFAAMQAGAYADRYAVAPTLLLITALAVLSSANERDDRQPRPAAGRSRALAYAPLIALCAIVGTNLVANYYGGSLPRANRPSWSSQVAAGRAACRAGGVTSARLETAPNDGWFVTVPCSRLLK